MSLVPFELSIEELRSLVGAKKTVGDWGGSKITGVATLAEAQEGDLSFHAGSRTSERIVQTKASVLLVSTDYCGDPQSDQLLLAVDHPSLAMAKACEGLAAKLFPRKPAGAHPTAVVDATASIDPSSYVGPHCVVEADVTVEEGAQLEAGAFVGARAFIGRDAWLGPRASIMCDSLLGQRVRVNAGSVIGADGFGYEFAEGRHRKIPQVGYVILGDDVEIGANSAVDRGRLGPTIVGEGTKIDNHVQVGHNVRIGKHCILCAQVGIAGSTVIEDFVVFGGRAGASGHLTIGQGSQIAGCSAAFSDLAPGKKWGGTPSMELAAYQRVSVLTRRLPDLFKRLKRLENAMLGEQ